MAHLTAEQTKGYRDMVKACYPTKDGWKFSVRKIHDSELNITMLQYPENYAFPEHAEINHLRPSETCKRLKLGKRETRIVEKLVQIAHQNHWDKSDLMTDYFHCSHYISVSIGRWDKPAIPKKI